MQHWDQLSSVTELEQEMCTSISCFGLTSSLPHSEKKKKKKSPIQWSVIIAASIIYQTFLHSRNTEVMSRGKKTGT